MEDQAPDIQDAVPPEVPPEAAGAPARCALCGEACVEAASLACNSCDGLHHRECWAWAGRCGRPGCIAGGRRPGGRDRPRRAVPERASVPARAVRLRPRKGKEERRSLKRRFQDLWASLADLSTLPNALERVAAGSLLIGFVLGFRGFSGGFELAPFRFFGLAAAAALAARLALRDSFLVDTELGEVRFRRVLPLIWSQEYRICGFRELREIRLASWSRGPLRGERFLVLLRLPRGLHLQMGQPLDSLARARAVSRSVNAEMDVGLRDLEDGAELPSVARRRAHPWVWIGLGVALWMSGLAIQAGNLD